MALVTGSIPNLIGGISQQNPVLRATTQSENIENCDCSIVRGLSKRRPLTWKYNLHAHKNVNDSYHFINRDVDEKYILHIQNGNILAFNFENGNTINLSLDDTLDIFFPSTRFESTFKRDDEDHVRFMGVDILSTSVASTPTGPSGEYADNDLSKNYVDLTDTTVQYSEVIHYTEPAIVESVYNSETDAYEKNYKVLTATKWIIKGTWEHQNIGSVVAVQQSATEDFSSATTAALLSFTGASSTKKIASIDTSFTPDTTKPWIRISTTLSPLATGTKIYDWTKAPLRYETADINSTAFDTSSYSRLELIARINRDRDVPNQTSDVNVKWEKSATEDFSSSTEIDSFTLLGGGFLNSKFIDYTVDENKPWVRAVLTDITSGFNLAPFYSQVVGSDPRYTKTSANHRLRFLTIADFTFIVNPEVVVKESTSNTSDSVGDLLIYTPTTLGGYTDIGLTLGTVKGSISDNYDEESSSEIWGLLMDEFITSISTSNIITLNTALKTSDNTVYGFSFAPGILWVDFRGDDIVFSTTGEGTAQRLRAITDTVTSFSQLPSYCVEGYKVKILNTDKFDEDDYYVEFFPNSSQTAEINSDIDQDTLAHVDADEKIKIGRWVETTAPDISIGLDPATMPMTLRRRPDGSFSFSAGEWLTRKVGDDISNSHPTFVGKPINYIDLYNNRLVFLSGDNIVLSELSEFFNFYRTTALTLLDSDPIDIASSGTSLSLLHSSVGLHNSLIVFSKSKQYNLTSGNPAYNLTPATINFPIISSFSSLVDVEPLALGNTIFFAVESGDHTGIKEYFITQDVSNQGDAVDITASVPRLLPKKVLKLVGSSTENLLIVLPDNTENINTTDSGVFISGHSELFVYKYYWQGNEKIQSAWSKWTFEAMYISDIFIIDEVLYIIYIDYVGTHIGSLPISEGYTDISEDSGLIEIGLGVPSENSKILKTIYLDKQPLSLIHI